MSDNDLASVHTAESICEEMVWLLKPCGHDARDERQALDAKALISVGVEPEWHEDDAENCESKEGGASRLRQEVGKGVYDEEALREILFEVKGT